MEFNFQENLEDLEIDLESQNLSEIYQMHDAVIFLVDIQALSFINKNIDLNNTEIVFNAYTSFLKSKIISSSINKCGLVFYNTVS